MQKRKSWNLSAALPLLAGLLSSATALAGPLDTLQPGQWYEFPNSHLRDLKPNPMPEGEQSAVLSYSGGTFDTKRNRLIVWGGGHAAYAGNEIYAFSVGTGQWARLTNPSSDPVSVHSYDQLEYLPNQDTFFAPGGAQWGSGSAIRSTWLFNFASGTWSDAGPMPESVYNFWYYNMTTDYDPASGKVIVIGAHNSGTFNPATKAWNLTGDGHDALGMTGALDTKRRRFVDVGRGKAYSYSVAADGSPGARTALATSGPKTIVDCDAPGFVYDPVSDRFVGWCSGSSVYTLNLDTLAWTQHSATNSVNPGTPYVEGTFGRFEYMPAYNAFIVVNSVYENVYAYKLSSGGGTAPATPTVSISASPATITSGSSATLTWSASNVSSCTASGAWSGSRATSGTLAVSPTATATYTLNCTGSNGSAANSAAVTVQAAGGGSTGGGSTGGGSTGGGSTGGGSTGGSSTSADTNFAARANGAGVVRAVGFDSQAEWLKYNADTSGCNPSYAPGCRENAWDSAVKASGAGSLRFDIRSQTGEGDAGNIAINFSDDNSVQFGANEEFWVQWRQRFDSYMIDHDYRETSGNGAWKQIILAQGDRTLANGSILKGYSCSEAEIVVGNLGGAGFPGGYMECGRYMNFDEFVPGDKYTKQNMRVNSSGQKNCIYFPRGADTSGCLFYYPNEWMTFMVHMTLGPVGRAVSSVSKVSQPGFVNSTYELYVARQGGAFELAHRHEGIVIPRGQYWDSATGQNPDNADDRGYVSGWSGHDGHPDAKYGKIWLTPFYTGKDGSEVTQNASTWYDEVIVSRQAIAAPGGSTPPVTPTPTVSLSASASSVVSGSSPTLTWSSSNASSCTASGGWTGSKATSGQQAVGPLTATTTFTLACGSATKSVTVTVTSGGGTGGGSGGGSSGGGSGGGSTTTYQMLLDVAGSASGQVLGGQSLAGVARVYVMPETSVTTVDYYIDGVFKHTEYFAPFELGGETFDFATLGAGSHSVRALVKTAGGQQADLTATITVPGAGGGTGGGSGGGSSGGSGNQAPAVPQIALANNSVVQLGDTVLDISTAYSDPDGDALLSSEWQIAKDNGFSNLVLKRSVAGPTATALRLAPGVLEPLHTYWIRTRQTDIRGAQSAWSPVVTVTTQTAMTHPSQADGDVNGNGVTDSSEGICDLLDAQSNNLVGIQANAGTTECLRAVSPSELPAIPTGTSMPYGLFAFRIAGLRVDAMNPARVTLQVHLPQAPAGAVKWYKYDAANGSLFELAGSVRMNGNVASVDLVDGGIGDFDGIVNGVIVDPSGPLVIPSAPGSSSGGSGGGTTGGGTQGSSSGGGSIGLFLPMLMAGAGLWRRRQRQAA